MWSAMSSALFKVSYNAVPKMTGWSMPTTNAVDFFANVPYYFVIFPLFVHEREDAEVAHDFEGTMWETRALAADNQFATKARCDHNIQMGRKNGDKL